LLKEVEARETIEENSIEKNGMHGNEQGEWITSVIDTGRGTTNGNQAEERGSATSPSCSKKKR